MSDTQKQSSRDKINAALSTIGEPVLCELVSLGGESVLIKKLSPRNIREWYLYLYDGKERTFEQEQLKLLVTCWLDVDTKEPFFTMDDAEKKLREQQGFGAVMNEFVTEARRVNLLFRNDESMAKERARFFFERASAKLAGAANQPSGETAATTGAS